MSVHRVRTLPVSESVCVCVRVCARPALARRRREPLALTVAATTRTDARLWISPGVASNYGAQRQALDAAARECGLAFQCQCCHCRPRAALALPATARGVTRCLLREPRACR